MLRASSSLTTRIHWHTVTSNHNIALHKIYKKKIIQCRCKHDISGFPGPYPRSLRRFITQVNSTKSQPDAVEVDSTEVTANLVKWTSETSMNKVDDEKASDAQMIKKSLSEQQPNESQNVMIGPRVDGKKFKIPWKSLTRVVGPGVHVINGFEDDALLHKLSTTSSAEEAWRIYEIFKQQYSGKEKGMSAHQGRESIPFVLRHRLARLLARLLPTRTTFYRLKTLLSDIQKDGGRVHIWEWNTLIHYAGSGWRRIRLENYRSALRIYYDMLEALSNLTDYPEHITEQKCKPDIYTYTTLLGIAMRTENPEALRHAISLLESSGLPPTRITILTFLRFRSKMNDLRGVQDTLRRLDAHGFNIGADGTNAVLWFHARAGRFDVAWQIYRSMMKNIAISRVTYEERESKKLEKVEQKDIEGLVVPDDALPDALTFTLMIQALAYHGYFFEATDVWKDMLTATKELKLDAIDLRFLPVDMTYAPTTNIFRSFFHGFAKYGGETSMLPPFSIKMYDGSSPWTLDNLNSLFELLMISSEAAKSTHSDRMIYWIMEAFAKTTNNDSQVLKSVWNKLETKFDRHWYGRMRRLQWMYSERENRDRTVKDKIQK